MRSYICNSDVPLDPCRYEALESAWILFVLPATILSNAQHIVHLRNRITGFLYVICYTARLHRVKRMHGRLKKILSPLGYRMHKLITNTPEIEDLHRYVPPWVNTKAYRESFASLFGVFVRRLDATPDFYIKPLSSPVISRTSDRPIEFIPIQPLNDDRVCLLLFLSFPPTLDATHRYSLGLFIAKARL